MESSVYIEKKIAILLFFIHLVILMYTDIYIKFSRHYRRVYFSIYTPEVLNSKAL